MLYFVRGRVKSGKTTYIIDKIKSEEKQGTLLLVPEPYSHMTERALCRACGNRVSGFAEVTSFRRLATKVKAEIGGMAVESVGGGRRILLLHSAMRLCASRLGPLSKAASNPEYLENLLSVIDEFKVYGISPEMIARAAEDATESLSRKLSDLGMIYAAYENALGEECEDVYDELISLAKSLRQHDFFAGKTLFLDGFSGFTAAEVDIIESAIAKARDVYIALELPAEYEEEAENGIFDKSFETMATLSERARRHGVEVRDIYCDKKCDGALSFLDKALFSSGDNAFSGDGSCITVSRADGIFEECELAAAYILSRVIENGARWRDFCVATASEEKYSGIVESAFSRYGIPVYTSEKASLPDKPIIALILSALECISRNFKTDSVMAYLKTGFSGICRRSLDIFEDYLYAWTPRGSEWSAEEGFLHNPLGITAEESEESRALLARINRIRKKIYSPLSKLRDALRKGKSGIAAAEALYDFINDINLARRCDAHRYLAEKSGRRRDAQEYDMLFGILCDAIDSIGRGVGDAEISTDELASLFRIVVSQYELGTIPATLDCVNVCSIEHAGGARVKYQIILGASEGSFPTVSDGAGVLNDIDRSELSDLGIELSPGVCERISEKFREIHAAMCAAERELYISSSAAASLGEETEEAPIVSRLRKIFPDYNTGLDIHSARQYAKAPFFDDSISRGIARDFWREDEQYRAKLLRAEMCANVPRGPITKPQNISSVFGKNIALSASRAELFSSCRYAYFMRYGMKARPRTRAEISPIEAGTLMHYVLENTIRALSESGEYNVSRALELSDEFCRRFVEESLQGVAKLSPRMEFMIKRLCRTVKDAVEDICRELSDSEFSPCDFELRFAEGGDLPAIPIEGEERKISLRGAVDRVDSFEKDGDLYFRVIDYKSGKKEFSLDEAVNGIGMQLLLYMFAIEELGEARYKKSPKPAGVMYVRISREMARGRGATVTGSKREGVVLRDMNIINAMEKSEKKAYLPVSVGKNGDITKGSSTLSSSEFEAVKLRMKNILKRIGDELSHGEIEANPYFAGTRSSCDYCDYKSVCRFDDAFGDDTRRDLFEVRAKNITESAEVKSCE